MCVCVCVCVCVHTYLYAYTCISIAPTSPYAQHLNLTWGSDSLAWFGSFGDSHPDAAADWTPLRLASDSSALIRSWDASRLQCDNVLASVEVQVLFVYL